MSQTSVSGLVGVSANSSLVFGRSAAFHAATSVCDTKVVSTPNLANSRPISAIVEPNIDREQITWSPALSRPMHIIRMAPMPVDAPMAASVPSMAARRCSKLGDRGVGGAAVGVALFGAGKTPRRGLGIGLHKTAGQVQRFGVFAVLAAVACATRTASVSRCRSSGSFLLAHGQASCGLGRARREVSSWFSSPLRHGWRSAGRCLSSVMSPVT